MPLDAEPHPDGNMVVDWESGRGEVLSPSRLALVAEMMPNQPRYRSHFVDLPPRRCLAAPMTRPATAPTSSTCPHAGVWRRR